MDGAGEGAFDRVSGADGAGGAAGTRTDGADGIDGTVEATLQICLSVAGLSFPVPHNEFAVF